MGASGDSIGEQRYYPFGEMRLVTGTMYTDRLFTGQREMTGSGIYYYGARYYSPKLGRFLSADTIVPGYSNPQALNRYSYVLNNPVKLTDPTGRKCVGKEHECEDKNGHPINGAGGLTSHPKKDNDNNHGCGQHGTYSPNCPGWHTYTTTMIVCPAELHCTLEEMKYYFLLFAYPGQNPLDGPVVSGNYYSVSWPHTDISMGSLGLIKVEVENGGFTTVNTTLPPHILYDGQVERTLSQLPDGSWMVTVHGTGNNVTHNVTIPLRGDSGTITIPVNLSKLNGWGGSLLPGGVDIFDGVNTDMRNFIIANH